MIKLSTLILHLIFCVGLAVAQNSNGARLTAMGNNTIAVKDVWSINSNPAGITDVKRTNLALSYRKTLFDTDISSQGLALIVPFDRNFVGLSVQRYGISEYNEINAGMAFAKTFGKNLSIGIKLNYHQINIRNYGSTNGFSADVGISYNYHETLSFAVAANNPTFQNYITDHLATKIPTIFSAGASYIASPKVLVAAYVKKEMQQPFDVGIGIDYQLIEILSLRAGITAKAFKQYAGFGLNYKSFKLDVAAESDPNLGYTPQIAMAYAF